MDAVVHRIEALPGTGRYAVTWRRADGSEQTAVVHLRTQGVEVAEASLPSGWTTTSGSFVATTSALRALDEARQLAPTRQLRDVDGGWDVSLGNVQIDGAGLPVCTAHGPMAAAPSGEYRCADCGARALLA
jgi:hypothetical protein